MSYEARMLKEFKMPTRKEVEEALLKSLFMHNGVIKEFGTGEEIVNEIAYEFDLNENQKSAYLETIYRKENRVKKSSLWHRLLFRAADSLAKEKLISRPTQTEKLFNKREWMLTEVGFDKDKKTIKVTRETSIRTRGFRQAVIEAYDFRCAVCGMKLNSPNSLQWEVEAAHIVPHSSLGKDDIWNGLALCRLHHWAFDVGWFTILDNYTIKISSRHTCLPNDFGQIGNFDFIKQLSDYNSRIFLPSKKDIFPHLNSIHWHRQNIFFE